MLLNAGHVVPLADLAETLWGATPPPSAQVTIQNYVMRLRRALSVTGRVLITTQQGGYLISAGTGELDISRFETLLAAARAAAESRSWDAAAGQAQAALALWRGEPLADVESELLAQREVPRLVEMRLQGLETRIGAELQLGRHAEVIAELRHLADVYPLREQLHALLMLALYRDNQQGEALVAYQHARRVLAEERGVDPGAVLSSLHRQILTRDPELITIPAADLGRQPTQGKQANGPAPTQDATVITTAGPASKSGVGAGAGGVVPRQLPAAIAHFTGRKEELKLPSRLLAGRGNTMGTVVISAIGEMAGVGKTALAIHWAHQVADQFPDGQLYMNLRGFGPSADPISPKAAVRGFLEALGVAPQRIPTDPDAQAGLYRSVLAGKKVLLVLDNARNEAQLRPLLPASPGCLTLVTRIGHASTGS